MRPLITTLQEAFPARALRCKVIRTPRVTEDEDAISEVRSAAADRPYT